MAEFSRDGERRAEWPRRALGWAAVIAVVALVLYVIGPVAQVLLLVFAGVLGAVFLDGLARIVSGRTRLSRGISLAVVVVAVLGVATGAAFLLVPRIVDEAERLTDELPGAFSDLRAQIASTGWGKQLLGWLPGASEVAGRFGELFMQAGKFIGGVVGVLGGILLIAFVSLAVAIEPGVYASAVLRLVPPERRDRWRDVFGKVREKMFWWVIGRLVNMLIIGTATSIGLAVIGVPAPVALGALAGVLTFVPNIGPIVSFVPAALLALTQGPTSLLFVSVLYALAQLLESYVVTPLIQRRATAVPPALLIAAQITLGVPLGVLGLLLATPLVGIAIVLIRSFYIEDRLGDRGGEPAPAE